MIESIRKETRIVTVIKVREERKKEIQDERLQLNAIKMLLIVV